MTFICYRSTGQPVKPQRDGFSSEDVKQLNKMYKCPGYDADVVEGEQLILNVACFLDIAMRCKRDIKQKPFPT